MNIFLRLGFMTSLIATTASFAGSLETGSYSLGAVAGVPQRSLAAERVIIRFDQSLEPLARKLLPRIDSLIAKLEDKLKFKLKHPMPLYLVSRGFGNAFVMGSWIAAPAYSVLPSTLTAAEIGSPVFSYAGFEEDAFDVFAHELMHYIEVDQALPPWGVVFGEGAYGLPGDASWMREGWAVIHESRDMFLKGRMKESYFGAVLKSGLSESDDGKLTGWDLSRNNRDWAFDGSQYLSGANFLGFLARKYGRDKVDEMMLSRKPLNPQSIYETSFGKSFSELLAEFNEELHASFTAAKNVSLQKPFFEDEVNSIGDIGVTSSGEILFWAAGLKKNSRVYRLSADTQSLEQSPFFEWFSPFAGNLSDDPLQWSAQSGKDSLYYFAAQMSPSGNEAIPGIYEYDIENHTRKLVRELPLARSAVVLPDGDTAYVLRQEDRNTNVFALEKLFLSSPQGKVETIARLESFSAVAQMNWDVERKVLNFTAVENGGTWGAYFINPTSGSNAELLIDTKGQELRVVGTPQGALFLSDFNEKTFQTYRLKGQQLCPLSNEPYFIKNFNVLKDGKIAVVSRRGKQDVLVSLSGEAVGPCRDMAEVSAPKVETEAFAPSTDPAFTESGWSALVPHTRAFLPSYARGGVWNFQTLFAGESPYKEWSWALLANVNPDADDLYTVAARVGFMQSYPLISHVTVETSPQAIGWGSPSSRYSLRFLTMAYEGQIDVNAHRFQFQGLSSTQTADDRSIPKSLNEGATSFGLRHSFNSTQGVVWSAGPQRGWGISSALQYVSSYFGSEEGFVVADLRQTVYLPLVASIFPTHSLSLNFSQNMTDKSFVYLSGSGGRTSNFGYKISPEFTQDPNLRALTGEGQVSSGYPGRFITGDKVLGTQINYAIPLNFMRYGFASLFSRRWLNPETSTLKLDLFYENYRISGFDYVVDKDSKTSLSSVGFVTTWSLWMNENQDTGFSAYYLFAKELNEGKNTSSVVGTSARVAF